MSFESAERPARIAVVEDNEADVYLLQKALQRAQVNHEFYHLPDGEAALHFFCRQAPYQNALRPDLLVLDLHLPRIDGPQMLQQLRKSDVLHQIPVIALTASSAPYTRAVMEALGVDYYVVKSFNIELYMQIGQLIKEILTGKQSKES